MDEAIDVVLLQEVALRPDAVEAMRKVAHKKGYRAYHTRGYADVNGIEHAGVLTLVNKKLPSRQRGAEGGRDGQVLAAEVAQVVILQRLQPAARGGDRGHEHHCHDGAHRRPTTVVRRR